MEVGEKLKSRSLAHNTPDEEVILSASNYGEEPFLSLEEEQYEEEEKFRRKFIQREIENMIRKSKEYKNWVRFIKSTLSVDFQCYHTGVLQEACTIHIHHHPYTLYDLCDIVMLNCSEFTTFDIAKLVMKLHYMNLVGFLPLCATSHESFHAGLLNIPVEIIEGNWKELPNYLEVPTRILHRIEEKVSFTFEDCECEWAVKEPMYQLSQVEPITTRHVDLKDWD